jgi:hypothetical protein
MPLFTVYDNFLGGLAMWESLFRDLLVVGAGFVIYLLIMVAIINAKAGKEKKDD